MRQDVSRFYLRCKARDVKPDTIVYKGTPDPRSRRLTKPYTLTNKISYYLDNKFEVAQHATKMLYLIDEKSNISFIALDRYVEVPFDTLEELQEYVKDLS